MLLTDVLRVILVLLVLGTMAIYGAESPKQLQELEELDIDRLDQELDSDDKIGSEEMELLRRKVDSMSDDQLANVLYAVMPHERTKRTIGTVRRCLDKVRCLFGAIKRSRSKRNSSPAAILRAISKLTSIASDAANELLGKRFGDTLSLSNLFKVPASASSSVVSDSLSDDSESLSSALSSAVADADDESSNLAEAGSEVVEKKTCDQRCNLSILVFRRLRRLLKRM